MGRADMRFEFLGYQFRIVFRHGKSVLLSDHFRHDVFIIRKGRDGQAFFGYGIWCRQCKMEIGHVSKALRERKTYCVIQYAEIGNPVNGKDLWVTVFMGVGDPNEKEGDRFTKEIGRRASLSNALRLDNFNVDEQDDAGGWESSASTNLKKIGLQRLSNLRGTFKEAAWAAFNGRKR
jgi:hypothetical protein